MFTLTIFTIYLVCWIFMIKILSVKKKSSNNKLFWFIWIMPVVIDWYRFYNNDFNIVQNHDFLLSIVLLSIFCFLKILNFQSIRHWLILVFTFYFILFLNHLGSTFLFNILSIDLYHLSYNSFYNFYNVLAGLFLLLLILIIMKISNLKIDNNYVTFGELIFAVILLYGFGFLVNYITDLRLEVYNNFIVYLLTFIATFSGILVIILILSYLNQKSKLNELIIQENLQVTYYKQQKDYFEKTFLMNEEFLKFKHNIVDEFNHINYLLNLNEIEELKNYLKLINFNEIKNYKKLSFDTGNLITNSIWNTVINHPKYMNDISAEWKGRITINTKISERDQLLLFANIFNNAFESAILSVEKKVDVRVSKSEDNIIFKLSNSYKGERFLINDKFIKTTKDNKLLHGYGNKIIERIVDENNLLFKYDVSDKFVSLVIIF